MSPIRVLLVDDEGPAREELKFLLRPHQDLLVVGEAEDGVSALERYRETKPDLVFLDIQIPGIQGVDLAGTLLGMAEPPLIVFVTAYETYAVRAFELHALDYLLKPISEDRFAETVRRIRETFSDRVGKYQEYLQGLRSLVRGYSAPGESGGAEDWDEPGGSSSDYLTLYADGRFSPLPVKKVVCLKAEGGATRVFSDAGDYLVYRPLRDLWELLPSKVFFQAHRSYVVNLSFIQHIDFWINGSLQLELRYVGEKVPVSRSKIRELKVRMNMQ